MAETETSASEVAHDMAHHVKPAGFGGPAVAPEIAVRAPATGQLLGTVPVDDPDRVREVVAKAREAQRSWGELRVKQRSKLLKRYLTAIADRMDEAVDLLISEGGKSRYDAVGEVAALFTGATYFLARGPKILRDRKIDGIVKLFLRARITYVPRGVIGMITPWNYPFVIPVYEAFAAWVAGNAVVLKPSEWTPLSAALAKKIWDESGMPADLFGVVNGYGETGAALLESGVDKIHFTGSVKVGKRVAGACGERLLPCTMELGGKAPVVVTEDADVELTAKAIVWGKFFNVGQTCIGVERVYAVGKVAGPLTQRIVEITKDLRQGDGTDDANHVGAMVMPGQVDIMEDQVKDAREKGAKILVGGERAEGPGRFFPPTVIEGTDHNMKVMTEETFGPLLPIMAVSSTDEAVALANDSHLGLNAYVFAGTASRGMRIARRLRAGTVVVGDVIANYALGAIPFGGVKQSGLGRSHGEEGLRAMTETRVLARPPLMSWPVARVLGYPYSLKRSNQARGIVRRLFGSRGRASSER